jgi:(2Fe-2S) ferredoxin
MEVLMKLRDEFEKRELGEIARPVGTTCLGPCETGVTVVVFPDNVWYAGVTVQDVPDLVESHIINNKPVERLLHKEDAQRLM